MLKMIKLFTMCIIFWILADTIDSQPINKLPRLSEYKGDIVKFTHRPLSPEESEIYDVLLEQVLNLKILELTSKDPRKFHQNLIARLHAISILYQSPHVKLMKPLVNFIHQLRPHHERLWKDIGRGEVCILAVCADEEVIDPLIEFLEHPLRGVRATSLEILQKVIKLPEGYRYGELSWVSLEDANKRKEVVKFLKDWWRKNKGKVKIYWKGLLRSR